MDELMKTVVGAVIDSATETTVDAVTNQTETVILETVATTAVDASVEDLALDTLDLLLHTGAAEGLAALFGAPVLLVLGIKALKSYRKRSRANGNS